MVQHGCPEEEPHSTGVHQPDGRCGREDSNLHALTSTWSRAVASPEYEDCLTVADRDGVPFKDVYAEAMHKARRILEG